MFNILLHYIMAFTFTLTENLTDLFNSNMGNPGIKLPSVVGDDANLHLMIKQIMKNLVKC